MFTLNFCFSLEIQPPCCKHENNLLINTTYLDDIRGKVCFLYHGITAVVKLLYGVAVGNHFSLESLMLLQLALNTKRSIIVFKIKKNTCRWQKHNIEYKHVHRNICFFVQQIQLNPNFWFRWNSRSNGMHTYE